MSELAVESTVGEKSFYLNVEFFPELGFWFRNKYKQGRKQLALRALEGKLAKIVATANGHRKNNVPKHAEVYRILWNKAQDAIVEFCREHKVPSSEVRSQMPALTELEEWGSLAPEVPSMLFQITVIVIAAIIGVFALGWASGLIQRIFHFGWAVAHIHAS